VNRKRAAPIFLLLAMVFLLVGISTDQETFSYLAIASAAIAFFANSKFFRGKK
jgi:hypothetical protein